MAYERDEVVQRIELAELCDQLLGPRKGRGVSGTWACPDPGHGPQTGRTPPVSVYRTHYGEQRWRCHGCGAGGSAVDLVMATEGLDVRAAIDELGRRSGAAERHGARDRHPSARALRPRPAPQPLVPSPELERYVAACEAHLWSPAGRAQRQWLAGRGLEEEVLVANRIGADPGPRRLARPPGLPRRGMAVVLPVLDDDGRAVYLQTRYLGHPTRRYDSPAAALAGVSPRLAELRTPGGLATPDAVVVCEGVLDGLSAAQAGQRAVAVLGVAAPNPAVAEQLARRYPHDHLVIAFDGDEAGRAGAERMAELLAAAGAGERVATIAVAGDLNAWAVAAGERFGPELSAAVAAATSRAAPAAGVDDAIETLWYRHVLVDDPVVGRANAEHIAAALDAFAHDRPPPPSGPAGAALDAELGAFAYRFALDDEPVAAASLQRASASVRAWSAELDPTAPALEVTPENPALAMVRAAAMAAAPLAAGLER